MYPAPCVNGELVGHVQPADLSPLLCDDLEGWAAGMGRPQGVHM